MAQDLRDLFKEDRKGVQQTNMLNGHEKRFEQLLAQRMPQQEVEEPQTNTNNRFYWMKIAAVFIVAVGVFSWFIFQNPGAGKPVDNAVVNTTQTEETSAEKELYLSDISPEFKQIEDYYLANINTELSQLTVTSENKELIDSFMVQLEQLDKEYQRLNSEIKESGIDEQTVSALINNLELRLDLLFKLKDKLKEIKKENLQNIQGEQI
ncbi:hypothetical protein [Mesonia mobilis]|uniref:hypothetical protein n=1 Tax=Mesonia mobilis TaxID=369791 RepID=UPI0024B885A5|nr:hypothetical protein [Mesonia mobilis]|tara:strand:- start:1601 stop:2224 length:624 start_codon:yes stop_codon:yes gene_type:complete